MDNTCFDGLDELYYHAKFGEDRKSRVGCRCENMVFVCFFLSHAPRPARCSFEGCIVRRTSIVLPFIGRFRRGFQLFQNGQPFQVHYIVLIFVARWRHNFRKIAVKNFEKSKNRRKSLCARLRADS